MLLTKCDLEQIFKFHFQYQNKEQFKNSTMKIPNNDNRCRTRMCKKSNISDKTQIKFRHSKKPRWRRGMILAKVAGGPGSTPGGCQTFFFFFRIHKWFIIYYTAWNSFVYFDCSKQQFCVFGL